jgi:hypothetical protein
LSVPETTKARVTFSCEKWLNMNEELACKKYKKFWEELIANFPLIRHGLHKKQQQKIKEETQTAR